MNHCFFCGKNFAYDLIPVCGFASALSCEECYEAFNAKQERENRKALVEILQKHFERNK